MCGDEQKEQEERTSGGWAAWKWLVLRQLAWFWHEFLPAVLAALGLPGSLLHGADSLSAVIWLVPASLRQHRKRAPEWSISLSPAGDALAILQNRQISIRYATDNFRITKATWKGGNLEMQLCAQLLVTYASFKHAAVPDALQGPAAQWRYFAWLEDSKYYAVGTISGDVYGMCIRSMRATSQMNSHAERRIVLQGGTVKDGFNIRTLEIGQALAGLTLRRMRGPRRGYKPSTERSLIAFFLSFYFFY